jgi:predicted nucleotidyltransferase
MINDVTTWISVQLAAVASQVVFARLFGSVASGSRSPSDCDILIVSDADPESLEWRLLRTRLRDVSKAFRDQFSIQLSTTLLTPAELVSLDQYIATLIPCVDFMRRPK